MDAADEDESCDAYVVAIPCYERNSDGSLGQMHYEGKEYPDYVGISRSLPYRWSYKGRDFLEEESAEHGVAVFPCLQTRVN